MSIRPRRGTRAQVDAAAGGGSLKVSELIYLTDEGKFGVATGSSAYRLIEDVVIEQFDVEGNDRYASATQGAKADSAGSMAYRNITIATSTPSGGSDGDFWAVV